MENSPGGTVTYCHKKFDALQSFAFAEETFEEEALAKKRVVFAAGLFRPKMKPDLATKLHQDRGDKDALCFFGPCICRTTHGTFHLMEVPIFYMKLRHKTVC